MPHHRRARDDKHSYAPASRFLHQTALTTMDIHEHRAAIPAMPAPATTTRVAMPALDELWR